MEIIELLLKIKPRVSIYYHKDTKDFSYKPVSSIQLDVLNQKGLEEFLKLYGDEDDISVLLPTYGELHHNEIMREFVKECVEEKDIRKCLFSILNRKDYIDGFIDKLKELCLYTMFEDVYSDYYNEIFKEWLIYNKIEL